MAPRNKDNRKLRSLGQTKQHRSIYFVIMFKILAEFTAVADVVCLSSSDLSILTEVSVVLSRWHLSTSTTSIHQQMVTKHKPANIYWYKSHENPSISIWMTFRFDFSLINQLNSLLGLMLWSTHHICRLKKPTWICGQRRTMHWTCQHR